MKVMIIEAETGNVVGTYSIILKNINSDISEDDYYSEAWTNAVEDGVVNPDEKSEYQFRFES